MDETAPNHPHKDDTELAVEPEGKRPWISNQDGEISAFTGDGIQHSGSGNFIVNASVVNIASRHQADQQTARQRDKNATNAKTQKVLDMRQKLMELLYFREIDERLLTLKAAHHKTCQWFLDTTEYKIWLNNENFHEHRGFLWIKGKPGAGKSILMKFLYSMAKTAGRFSMNAIVLSFFFNARGGELEKSTIGLYKSILWQLLQKAEDLQGVLDDLGPNDYHLIQNRGWQLETLKNTFFEAIKLLERRKLQLFIDALDECSDEEVEDMISFFEEVGECATEKNIEVHICFSSRHYPTINIRFGKQVTLENERGHTDDIALFIHSNLRLNNSKRAEVLKLRIQEKSMGLFLWVALVIAMLNKACAKGRVEEFQKCLDRIPPGLDDLFEMILKRDNNDMQELRLCIQWILFAQRPLTLKEYYFALRKPINIDTTGDLIWDDITSEDMNLYVESSSKGLAEVTRTRESGIEQTVQFIHESVRDFLLDHGGINKLWPDFKGDSANFTDYTHEILKTRCMVEIKHSISFINTQWNIKSKSPTVPDFRRLQTSQKTNPLPGMIVSQRHPFFKYAVRHVLNHANDIECNQSTYEKFLIDFPHEYWIYLNKIIQPLEQMPPFRYLDETLSYSNKATLLYIFSHQNLHRLITQELRRIPNMDIPGEKYFFPMFAASVNNNREAIMALLMQSVEKLSESILKAQLDSFCQVKPRQYQTPLSTAAEMGHEVIVQLLLETKKVDVDRKDRYKKTPLSYAAEKGHLSVVKLLLGTNKVDVDSKDNYGRTSLSYAAERGHESIVKLLLATGKVDPDIRGTLRGRTPLSYAAERGHRSIVGLLLGTKKVDIHCKDHRNLIPREYAAKNGHVWIVKLLSQRRLSI